ncbi:MAG: tyrosine-type recombinase/integrase [Fulvivirga sp.]
MPESQHLPRNLPYRPAHLVKEKRNGKIYYAIKFWVWSEDQQKMVKTRRFFDLNKGNLSTYQLNKKAQKYIGLINHELINGYHVKSETDKKGDMVSPFMKLTISSGLKMALKIKIEVNSIGKITRKTYTQQHEVIQQWLSDNGYAELPIKRLDAEMIQQFLDHIKHSRKVNNKTYNHYLANFKSFYNELKKRDPKNFIYNPFDSFQKLKVKAYKHPAFNNQQMAKIANYLTQQPEKKLLLRYIQWLYYTLARPNEVRNIKVGDIDLENNRILIQGENSKGDEDYCGIAPPLLELIKEDRLLDHQPNFYVFGSMKFGGIPGLVNASGDYFYEQNKKMLNALNLLKLNAHYSIYSYKHSGALSLYTETKDIKLLQRQMRHKKVSQTEDYLRDLGIMGGYEDLKKWKGAI